MKEVCGIVLITASSQGRQHVLHLVAGGNLGRKGGQQPAAMRDLASVHLIFWCVQSSRTRATRPTTVIRHSKNFFFKTENLKWSRKFGRRKGQNSESRIRPPRGPEAEGIRILHHPIHHDHTPYSQGTHPFLLLFRCWETRRRSPAVG